MKPRLLRLAALAAGCMLVFSVAACGDKHEPTKPTVAAAVSATR
ncbi:hypothetical protein [Massilia antarctica]|nr:hypothetical protein [Massilia sp. H27-R4]MCY0910580.1 hypothetical protein [Massilia sp. H27-R4]CUI09056.1 hypothetical protein BN2497_12889 [Janthinobacterium sp. CG23_2]CUU32842.1 hypothetical protein BN3177_12889 [Janthinobacterium sp. CG23_2]